MAVDLQVELTDDDRELDISKEIVAATTDEAVLADWYTALAEKHLEVQAFAKGFADACVQDDDYFRRAGGTLAYCRIAMRWIENRMFSLGFMPPFPPTDPRTRTINTLTEKVKKLTAQIARLEGAPS